jgi:hypothetical protein
MGHTEGKNTAAVEDRNIPLPEAERRIARKNAESTYNTWTNNQAFDHLKSLHMTVGMLGQHPDIASHPAFGEVQAAVSGAIAEHGRHHVGDLLSGERFGPEHPKAGQLIYGTGSRAYVGAAQQLLGGISHNDEGVNSLLQQAQTHASNFLNTYEPAKLDENKNKNRTLPREQQVASVVQDPEYRLHAFDYTRPTEATPEAQKEADKDWQKQMGQTADGRYPKTAQYEAAKKAKGYKKPAKPKTEGQ